MAVEVTSLLMRRLPRKLWCGVHLTSYAVFALSTLHMFTAGTDREHWALQWVALGTVMAVGFLTVARVLGGRGSRSQPAAAARARASAERRPATLVSVGSDSDAA